MKRHLVTGAAIGIAFTCGKCPADTFTPITQNRRTEVIIVSDCDLQKIDEDIAAGFDPFESNLFENHACPEIPIFVSAIAFQNSTIGATTFDASGSVSYGAQSSGSVLASGLSEFTLKFTIDRPSNFDLTGLVLGDGQVPGVETGMEFTDANSQTLFSHVLTGPFPLGEPTEQAVDEHLVLAAGTYTLHARALAADAIDIAQPFFSGEAAFNLTAEVRVLGDVDGDEIVGVVDLLALLGSWGVCQECPADLDRNGAVNVSDLLLLLGNWG